MSELEFRCDRVAHTFHSRNGDVRAVDSITLGAQVGEIVCIVGPSGCGKSTMLRIVAGLLTPSEGAVIYGSGGDTRRHRTGVVFQDHGVFPWLPVIDNVGFGLEMQGVPRPEREQRSLEMLERVQLKGFARAYPHELSVGMRQRVGVARAFVSDVQLLLMDEPFGSLDAQTKRLLLQDLVDLWSGSNRTVVYVTHDVEEAIALGDRIVVLSERPGRIIREFQLPAGRQRGIPEAASPETRELTREIWQLLGVGGPPRLAAVR